MNQILKFIYDFVLLFLLIYLIYWLYYRKKKSDYSKLSKKDEIKMFIARYDLDMRKTKYKTVLNIVCLCNAIIIAFTATLILKIDNFFLKVAVSFITIFALIYALFEIFGRLLKKKEGDAENE